MSNPEFHTCPICGYTWEHGRDGSHNCTVKLRQRIAELESERDAVCSQSNASNREIERLFDELEGYKESKLSKDALIREIDKIITDGQPAKQASLCDLVGPIRKLKEERDDACREAAEAQALHIKVIQAWESLPEGKHSPQVIEQWMHGPMACAISELRRPNQSAVAAAIDKAIDAARKGGAV